MKKFIYILLISFTASSQIMVQGSHLSENSFSEEEYQVSYTYNKKRLNFKLNNSKRKYIDKEFKDTKLSVSKDFKIANYKLRPTLSIGPKNKIKERFYTQLEHSITTNSEEYIFGHKYSIYEEVDNNNFYIQYYRYLPGKISFIYGGLNYSKTAKTKASSYTIGFNVQNNIFNLNMRLSTGEELMDATSRRDFFSKSLILQFNDKRIPSLQLTSTKFKANIQKRIGLGYIWNY